MSFSYSIEAVAYCRSPYQQKFGIPRQPGLVSSARGYIDLVGPFNNIDCVRGLEQYSHLWINFCFHENLAQGWKTTVRPPRLGGNEKLGVFATRSTFRPNGIGQSVVKLESVHYQNGQVTIEISGMDLLNNTPVIDIKPYIPFSDSVSDAHGGIAQQPPVLSEVKFAPEVSAQLEKLDAKLYPDFKTLITQVLAQDPRPAYKKSKLDDKIYQVALFDFDILWQVTEHAIVVQTLRPFQQ